MLAKVCSAAVNGIDAYPIEVEVNAGYGDTVIVVVVNKTPKRAKALILRAKTHILQSSLTSQKGIA